MYGVCVWGIQLVPELVLVLGPVLGPEQGARAGLRQGQSWAPSGLQLWAQPVLELWSNGAQGGLKLRVSCATAGLTLRSKQWARAVLKQCACMAQDRAQSGLQQGQRQGSRRATAGRKLG